jgi:hypothetical protein
LVPPRKAENPQNTIPSYVDKPCTGNLKIRVKSCH